TSADYDVTISPSPSLKPSPCGRGERARQGNLFFNGQTPLQGHLDVARVDQGGPFAHGNVTGNTNQATEFAETATQHARLPGPVSGRRKPCPHTAGTKMRDLAITSDFLGHQPGQEPAVLWGVVHHRARIDLITIATDARAQSRVNFLEIGSIPGQH